MVGISHARVYIIWGLYRDIGERAFELRSSRPHHSHRRSPERIERRIERARRRLRWGPLRLSWELGLARSTIYALLRRLQLHRLRFFLPPRPVFRRYERAIAFTHFNRKYNYRRRHGELGGLTPMQRLLADVNNVRGQHG
jgi:transposase InsO family protein